MTVYNKHALSPAMGYFKIPKKYCLPDSYYSLMKKLLIVPDRCLPIKTPVESIRAHHSFKLTHLQCRLNIYKSSLLPKTLALGLILVCLTS